MKKGIIIILISTVLFGFIALKGYLQSDTRIDILNKYLSSKSYDNIRFISSTTQTEQNNNSEKIKTIIVHFAVQNYLCDLTKDSLQVKSEIEDLMKNNKDYFSETYLKIIIDYPDDSSPDIIIISNYDFESNFISSDLSSLTYGFFNNSDALISNFSYGGQFENLTIWVDNVDEIQAIDAQKNLLKFDLHSKSPIAVDDENHLKESHPNCIIFVNRKEII